MNNRDWWSRPSQGDSRTVENYGRTHFGDEPARFRWAIPLGLVLSGVFWVVVVCAAVEYFGPQPVENRNPAALENRS